MLKANRTILLVEPNAKTSEKIKKLFEDEEITITSVDTVDKAHRIMLNQPFDLIISELKTKKGTIFDLARAVQKDKMDSYLLMWTKETDVSILFQCYKVGVDSINSKNRPAILVKAKCMAMFRRMESWRTRNILSSSICIGVIRVDRESQKLFVKEKRVKLSQIEFKLFMHLFINLDKTVTKEKLLQHIWDSDEDKRQVDVYVHRLRSKVGNFIKTVRKEGYIIKREMLFEKTPE